MKTKITELLGIQYPIFQGGMAWISDGRLAAAVSNGGGLGIIATGNSDVAYVKAQISLCRALTDKPFGVNLMLRSPYVVELAELLAQEKIPVITTGAGSPKPYLEQWVEAGCKVMPVIANATMARKMTGTGVAAVIAEGSESGGHVGELTTMALLPQVCDATDLPVIAAGGIADGRQGAAAFVMGAEGVQVGTRFLLAKECGVHPHFKEKIIGAKDSATTVAGRRIGMAVRALDSAFTQKFTAAEYDSNVSNEALAQLGAGALKYAAVDGDEEKGSFQAGQVASMLDKEETAAEILQALNQGIQDNLKRASRWEC